MKLLHYTHSDACGHEVQAGPSGRDTRLSVADRGEASPPPPPPRQPRCREKKTRGNAPEGAEKIMTVQEAADLIASQIASK
jgi:hypothetical protein